MQRLLASEAGTQCDVAQRFYRQETKASSFCSRYTKCVIESAGDFCKRI